MTSRVLRRLGTPALPASLRSKSVACCSELTARIWAKRSPGPSVSSPIPRPGRIARSISDCSGGAPCPVVISRVGASARPAPLEAIASMSDPSRWVACNKVTSGPSKPLASSDAAMPRSPGVTPDVGVDAERRLSRATPHASGTRSRSTPAGSWGPKASVVLGPTAVPPAAVRRKPSSRVEAHGASAWTSTVRSPEST